MSEARTVFFVMVDHPLGPKRVGNAYSSRKSAQSWVPLVRAAWKGIHTYVEPAELTFVDGKLDAASVELLDKKFNMDPPGAGPKVPKESDRE